VNVIDADTCAADDLEVGRGGDQLFGDLGGRADGKAVILADDFKELFLVLAKVGQVINLNAAIFEDLDGSRRKFVGYEYAGCHHGLLRQVRIQKMGSSGSLPTATR